MDTVDEYWRALTERNLNYDNIFCYGVSSTGVFCKPSCSSRVPLRGNVRFFDSVIHAKTAGFRPCKKCYPIGQGDESRPIDAVVHELCSSPKNYQMALRTQRLKNNLKAGKNLSNALYDSGYSSPSRVYENIATTIGMTPKQYSNGGQGIVIHHATCDTSLGIMMLAATSRGICFLRFGTSEQALFTELRSEFTNAELRAMPESGTEEFDGWMEVLSGYLERRKSLSALPLDIRGTAFQIAVWSFLQTIPEGEIRSYTEVAHGIGRPNAVRAVASACARNGVALLLPCHRVLRGDGALAGYRWGLERKRALLDLEMSPKTD